MPDWKLSSTEMHSLLVKPQSQITKLRDDRGHAMKHMDKERNKLKAALQFLEDHEHDFAELLAEVNKQNIFQADSERLNRLHRRLQTNAGIHKAQSEVVKAIEKAASNLESRLATAEQEFASASERTLALLPEVSGLLRSELKSEVSDRFSNTISKLQRDPSNPPPALGTPPTL